MKLRKESKYFHPREFVSNNIEYRIASSLSMSKFKETQSFILNQLAFNPYHTFSKSAKEILLFKFDIWFDLLCEIEQYILIKQEKCSFDEIWDLLELRKSYEEETLPHVETILPQYIEIHSSVKLILFEFQKEVLEDILNLKLTPAGIFGAIVDLVIVSLNHILYTSEEIDRIFDDSDEIILNLDYLSCELEFPISKRTICPVIKRVTMYLNEVDFDSVIIKNYIGPDFDITRTQLATFLDENHIKYKIV